MKERLNHFDAAGNAIMVDVGGKALTERTTVASGKIFVGDEVFAAIESERAVKVTATVKTTAATGVEMEALHAVSVGLLTIFDMCKAIDKSMILADIRLEFKSGGKSQYQTCEL